MWNLRRVISATLQQKERELFVLMRYFAHKIERDDGFSGLNIRCARARACESINVDNIVNENVII